MTDDPSDLGSGRLPSSNVPPIPGPPAEPTAREIIIRSMSDHKLQRMDALLEAGMNTGDIAVQLSIQSSVVVMCATRRAEFDAIRANADPRNLGGGGPVALTDPGGRSYRPGVMRGS